MLDCIKSLFRPLLQTFFHVHMEKIIPCITDKDSWIEHVFIGNEVDELSSNHFCVSILHWCPWRKARKLLLSTHIYRKGLGRLNKVTSSGEGKLTSKSEIVGLPNPPFKKQETCYETTTPSRFGFSQSVTDTYIYSYSCVILFREPAVN